MNDGVTVENLRIDPRNAGQLRDWDGEHGRYWAERADSYNRGAARYHPLLLAAAGVRAGDRILDIGCGSGQVAIDLVRAVPNTSAVGVDLSSDQLDVARRRGSGLPVEFIQADAQIHDFGAAAFDVVVSRTGTMFFADQTAACANFARATKSGGRLALLVWRSLSENEWLREFMGAVSLGRDLPAPPPGAPGPFAQSDRAVVESVLQATGWTAVTFTAIDEPMVFGSDADDATTFLVGQMAWLLNRLPDAERIQAIANLRAVLAAHETPYGVQLGSGAWLITARRA
jgi:SAM-dependent methyltransferase